MQRGCQVWPWALPPDTSTLPSFQTPVVNKGDTERAVSPGTPSVPFVSDGMEDRDRYIDLISLECST